MTKARTLADNFAADINAVTADAPLTGGGTSGTVTVGIQAGTTAQSGAVQLTDSTASTSTTTAATPNSVKSAYDLADAAIAKSIVDAKADLITATADNTPARLAVGNNGDTLVADSSATTGLRWQSNYSAGKNALINGDFRIWQRGTSGSVPNTFTYQADRFWATHNGSTSGTITCSRQSFAAGQTDVPNNPLYFARITNTTLGTSQTQTEFGQFIEDVNTFAGQTVTFSFYVKASGTFTLQSWAWQGFGSGGSSSVFTGLTLSSSTTSTSWQRITATVTVPSVSGKTIGAGSYLGFYVRMVSPTAGSTIDFSNWQVEAGNVATAFQTATGTLAGELAACQRYFWRYGIAIADTPYVDGRNRSTTSFRALVRHPVTMRGNPTFASSTVSNFAIYEQSNAYTVTSLVSTDLSPTGTGIQASVTSGLTSGYASSLLSSPGITTSYMDFSAEL